MTDIDLELIKIISNRRRLKAFVRRSSISVDEIESVFTDVITELKNEFGKELEQKRLHDQKIAEFKELLKAENLSLSDFFDVAEQEQKPPASRKLNRNMNSRTKPAPRNNGAAAVSCLNICANVSKLVLHWKTS